MLSYILIEVIRERLEECSMRRLKIDFENMGNSVSVVSSGDPCDPGWIEVYHSIKSVLIAGLQW
jgi:hypothetical protein